jgi:NAD(P)-dependent dehydrogenase (short-subunit alcohol dehydrogenase family)
LISDLLLGRNAIITGANQGLGFAIARAYLEQGANIVICARDGRKLESAFDELKSLGHNGQKVEKIRADVSVQKDVKALVEFALEKYSQIHILVNNAGIYGPKGKIEDVDWNEWEQAIRINLLGSILVARSMLPHFREHHYGKIIQLSGGGATNPLPFISAYAASKAGVVRFMETLAEETRADHIDINSIAPGALNTRLLDEVLDAGPEKVGKAFYERAIEQKEGGGTPLNKSADLAVFLASPASDGITGKLISAVWDPWRNFSEHQQDIDKSDIYTLRRIVPKDRGMDWGDA